MQVDRGGLQRARLPYLAAHQLCCSAPKKANSSAAWSAFNCAAVLLSASLPLPVVGNLIRAEHDDPWMPYISDSQGLLPCPSCEQSASMQSLMATRHNFVAALDSSVSGKHAWAYLGPPAGAPAGCAGLRRWQAACRLSKAHSGRLAHTWGCQQAC